MTNMSAEKCRLTGESSTKWRSNFDEDDRALAGVIQAALNPMAQRQVQKRRHSLPIGGLWRALSRVKASIAWSQTAGHEGRPISLSNWRKEEKSCTKQEWE